MKLSFKKIIAIASMVAILLSSLTIMGFCANCEHDWQITENVEPRCWANGSVTYTCTKCKETKKETVYTEGHKWENCRMSPDDEMFHVSFCKKCGSYMYEDHTWANGNCLYCGCEQTAERIYKEGRIPPQVDPSVAYEDEDVGHPVVACTHENKKGTVVEPTCEESGYTLYECENCSYTHKENWVERLGHKWGDCSLYEYDEMFHSKTCDTCGQEAFEPHKWDKESKGGKCVDCGCEYKADRVNTGRAPYIIDEDSIGFFGKIILKILKVISPNWLYPWYLQFKAI